MKFLRSGVTAAAALAILSSAGYAVAQSSDGMNRRVEVHNHTDTSVFEFYASTTRETSWEEDILGTNVILPGAEVRMNLDDGTNFCEYDIKVVFRGGVTLYEASVNVCAVSIIDIYANDIRPR